MRNEALDTFLKAFPAVMPFLVLLFSGSTYKFVQWWLTNSQKNRRQQEREDRLYEIGFRLCEGECRNKAQFVIMLAGAHKAVPRNNGQVLAYLNIVADSVGSTDSEGKWHAHAFPNFLERARAEMALAQESSESQPEEKDAEDK